MTRFLTGIVLALCACAADDPPNIIFVFTDDHATHAVSAYGSTINTTPNIDRIAEEGVRFSNAFVTNSICAPSRAAILTGQFGHVNGVPTNRETLDTAALTFPKLLQGAGYQTAIVGKWHLKSEPQGFDHWEVLPGQGTYYNPRFRTPSGEIQVTGYTTDIITDKALEWLETGRDPDQPFMLMYQHKAPHRPWDPGPDHLNTFEGETIPEPIDLFDDYANRSSATDDQEMTISGHMNDRDLKFTPPPELNDEQLAIWNAAYGPKNEAFLASGLEGDDRTRWNYQRYIKDYLRSVASVDDNLGRVLDYLDASGLAENTVIIYASDQGFYLGDHGWYDKRWMYEESLRMPLVMRWPAGIEAGTVRDELVQNFDLAATFLELAGVPVPAQMQGMSLAPLIRGDDPQWRDAIYYQYWEYPGWHMVRRHYGVRTDRYKLIHYYGLNEWELFDLEQDPDELRSVYDEPEYADIQGTLLTRLRELRVEYDAPETDPYPYPDTWQGRPYPR